MCTLLFKCASISETLLRLPQFTLVELSDVEGSPFSNGLLVNLSDIDKFDIEAISGELIDEFTCPSLTF